MIDTNCSQAEIMYTEGTEIFSETICSRIRAFIKKKKSKQITLVLQLQHLPVGLLHCIMVE